MAADKNSLKKILQSFLTENTSDGKHLLAALAWEPSVLGDAPGAFASDLDVAVDGAARLAARKDPEHPLNQQLARKRTLALFKRLETSGFGKLMLGRRGRPTRFEWPTARSERLMRDAVSELGIHEPRHLVPPPIPTVEAKQPLRRAEVVALLEEHRSEIQMLGVRVLSLFGSVARDEARPDSDIDFLVTYEGPVTSDAFFATKFFLEDLFGRPVDLVIDTSLRDRIRRAIEPELIRVA